MVTQKADIRAAHGAGDALALGVVQRQAVVLGVNGYASMEAHGVLRQGGIQCPCGGERERRCVGHVRVHHAGFAADLVNARVDEHGRGLYRVPSSQLAAVGVDHHDVVSLDFAPHQPARIEQKAPAGIG